MLWLSSLSQQRKDRFSPAESPFLMLLLLLLVSACSVDRVADAEVVEQGEDALDELAWLPPEPSVALVECAESTETIDFNHWMTVHIAALPAANTNTYHAPTPVERQQFKATVAAVLEARCADARALAHPLGFRLVELQDGHASFLYFEPTDTRMQAHGIYLIRAHDQWGDDVVYQAPHPLFDQGTGLLAARAFFALDGAALAIAGTHRCANLEFGHADGTTRVCNEGHRHKYRESDMAHADQSLFQAFHEVTADTLPDSVAIQLHAFAQDEDDPMFIVSNGTTHDGGEDDLVNQIHGAILESLALDWEHPTGASCNLPGHDDSLCATTNVQGRFSNGVPAHDVATREAAFASGRFIHVELGREIRFTDGVLSGHALIEGLAEAVH